MPTHKYFAKPCECDGIKFPSQMERNYYLQLKMLVKSEQIRFFLRQPRFELPGGCKYTADFQIVNLDGSIEFVDVKGVMTEAARLRIRMVEAIYPVKIKIVKKV